MLYLVHDIRDRGSKPNFEVLRAMIYYIDAFPERFTIPRKTGSFSGCCVFAAWMRYR
jgi:hypothetical protein